MIKQNSIHISTCGNICRVLGLFSCDLSLLPKRPALIITAIPIQPSRNAQAGVCPGTRKTITRKPINIETLTRITFFHGAIEVFLISFRIRGCLLLLLMIVEIAGHGKWRVVVLDRAQVAFGCRRAQCPHTSKQTSLCGPPAGDNILR